jgi:GNAT superfamily N-acetyltransferase
MAILLHNLCARAPQMNDAAAVADLLLACDRAEQITTCYTQAYLLADWQRPGFALESDAWMITTKNGQVAGYADVWLHEGAHIVMRIRVHPDHRQRGIGTLLLRLAEDQARRLVKRANQTESVALYSVIGADNSAAKRLLEHEGFALARRCWRVGLDVDEPSVVSADADSFTLEFQVDADDIPDFAASAPRTGFYNARCFDVYEKTLSQSAILYAAEPAGSAA